MHPVGAGEGVAAEMQRLERRHRMPDLGQRHKGARQIGQIGPGMPRPLPTGVDDEANGLARLDQALPADQAQALLQRLRADPAVVSVAVDRRVRRATVPTDPYSHTPGFAGVQQPGMTGQVKEEILTRWGELGLRWQTPRTRFGQFTLNADANVSSVETVLVPVYTTVEKEVQVVVDTIQVPDGVVLVPEVTWVPTQITEQVGTERVVVGSSYQTMNVALQQIGYFNHFFRNFRK